LRVEVTDGAYVAYTAGTSCERIHKALRNRSRTAVERHRLRHAPRGARALVVAAQDLADGSDDASWPVVGP